MAVPATRDGSSVPVGAIVGPIVAVIGIGIAIAAAYLIDRFYLKPRRLADAKEKEGKELKDMKSTNDASGIDNPLYNSTPNGVSTQKKSSTTQKSSPSEITKTRPKSDILSSTREPHSEKQNKGSAESMRKEKRPSFGNLQIPSLSDTVSKAGTKLKRSISKSKADRSDNKRADIPNSFDIDFTPFDDDGPSTNFTIRSMSQESGESVSPFEMQPDNYFANPYFNQGTSRASFSIDDLDSPISPVKSVAPTGNPLPLLNVPLSSPKYLSNLQSMKEEVSRSVELLDKIIESEQAEEVIYEELQLNENQVDSSTSGPVSQHAVDNDQRVQAIDTDSPKDPIALSNGPLNAPTLSSLDAPDNHLNSGTEITMIGAEQNTIYSVSMQENSEPQHVVTEDIYAIVNKSEKTDTNPFRQTMGEQDILSFESPVAPIVPIKKQNLLDIDNIPDFTSSAAPVASFESPIAPIVPTNMQNLLDIADLPEVTSSASPIAEFNMDSNGSDVNVNNIDDNVKTNVKAEIAFDIFDDDGPDLGNIAIGKLNK